MITFSISVLLALFQISGTTTGRTNHAADSAAPEARRGRPIAESRCGSVAAFRTDPLAVSVAGAAIHLPFLLPSFEVDRLLRFSRHALFISTHSMFDIFRDIRHPMAVASCVPISSIRNPCTRRDAATQGGSEDHPGASMGALARCSLIAILFSVVKYYNGDTHQWT